MAGANYYFSDALHSSIIDYQAADIELRRSLGLQSTRIPKRCYGYIVSSLSNNDAMVAVILYFRWGW